MDDRERNDLERRIRAKALSKARAKLGFRWHAVLFAMVNVAIYAINMAFTPTIHWFVWPLAAWSAGLAIHGFAVFSGPQVDEDAIEAEVQRELARRGASSTRASG